MTMRSMLCAFGLLLLIGVSSGPVEARKYGNCYWDGTSPFCEGRCRAGFVIRGQKACFSGWKVKCCEPMGSVSQSQKRR
ncbi:MAG: hypothetical protein R3D62_12685 [Xanthobacteraceae bacterium]